MAAFSAASRMSADLSSKISEDDNTSEVHKSIIKTVFVEQLWSLNAVVVVSHLSITKKSFTASDLTTTITATPGWFHYRRVQKQG